MESIKTLSEQKREDILNAAVLEFTSNGFRGTNMDRIAKTAQVSKRTVYKHFNSKVELFQAIEQQLCDNVKRVTEHIYNPQESIENQLQSIARQHMDLLSSETFLETFKMITTESLASPELTRENFENFQESDIGVVKWIKKARKDGQLLVSDPVIAGKQFLTLIEAFALWPQLYGLKPILKKTEQQKIIDATVEMFLNTYGQKEKNL